MELDLWPYDKESIPFSVDLLDKDECCLRYAPVPEGTLYPTPVSQRWIHHGQFSAEIQLGVFGEPLKIWYHCTACREWDDKFEQLRLHVTRRHVSRDTISHRFWNSTLLTVGKKAVHHLNQRNRHSRDKVASRIWKCGGPGEEWGCQRQFDKVADLYNHFRTKCGQDCVSLFLIKRSVDTWRGCLMNSRFDELNKSTPGTEDVSALQAALLATYLCVQAKNIPAKRYGWKCDDGSRQLTVDSKVATAFRSDPPLILPVLDLPRSKTSTQSQSSQSSASEMSYRPLSLDRKNAEIAFQHGQHYLPSLSADATLQGEHLQPGQGNFSFHSQQSTDHDPGQITMSAGNGNDSALSGISHIEAASGRSQDAGGQCFNQSSHSDEHETNIDSELSFIGPANAEDRYLSELECLTEETWLFIEDLANRIVKRGMEIYNRLPLKSCPGSQSDSTNSTMRSGSNTQSSKTSLTPAAKRSHQTCNDKEGFDDDDNNDDDDRSPHSKRLRGKECKSARLFACPYAKFDLDRYSEQNQTEKHYRKCASKYLTSITRVKQHLYRTHMRPEWYCGNCYQSFETRERLNQHNRMRPPCELSLDLYEEKMTDDQFREIKRRSQGNNECESWFKIFQILFPQAPKPVSPFVSTSDSAAVQHFVTFFRWFGPEEFFHLMRDRQERNNGVYHFDASTQAVIDEAFEIALPDYLEQLRQNRNSSSQRPDLVTVDRSNPSDAESRPFTADQNGWNDTIGPIRQQMPSLERFGIAAGTHSLLQPPVGQITNSYNFSAIDSIPELPPLSVSTESRFDPSEVENAFEAYGSFTDIDLEPFILVANQDEGKMFHDMPDLQP